jgi:alditol oxidase
MCDDFQYGFAASSPASAADHDRERGTPMRSMTNWAGNVTFGARWMYRPASVGELQRLVARNSRLRPLGTGHSFTPLADTSGELVSVAGLPRLTEVDSAAGAVLVSAGLSYGELAGTLQAAGRGLASLASLLQVCVAGACATGTHGSGDANRSLAAAVRALELVTADGDLLHLDRSAGDFPGAVVALGALGIVTTLTLDTVPAFEIRQYVYDDLPLEQVLSNFGQIFAAAYSVSLFTTWRRPAIDQAWLKHRADAPGAATTGQQWMGGRLADGPRHPVPGMPSQFTTAQRGVPGPWHERLPHFRMDSTPSAGAELQSEFLLPRASGIEALTALHRISELLAPVVQVSEIRTIAADDLWLSPACQRDSVGFHFTWIPDYQALAPALAAVEDRLAPLGARPHWGKLFGMSPQALRARYPRADDFRQLMRRYDPAGKFRNDFLDRYLPA